MFLRPAQAGYRTVTPDVRVEAPNGQKATSRIEARCACGPRPGEVGDTCNACSETIHAVTVWEVAS